VGRQINEFSRGYKISNIGIYISRLGGEKSEPEKLEVNFAKFAKAQRSGRPYTLRECKLEEKCKARSFRRQTQNCRRQQFNKGSIRSPSH
jgi:hypothetical protein